MSTAPDYGEPWEATSLNFLTTKGNFSTGVLASLHSKRIAQCVNDCAGMADPEAEITALRRDLGQARGERDRQKVKIAAMREAIEEAREALKAWPRAGSGMNTDFTAQSEAFRTGQRALAKLQPFIKP